ncbi:MAG: tetratricopeptide repeat protein [Candidatus Binatia bacterium]
MVENSELADLLGRYMDREEVTDGQLAKRVRRWGNDPKDLNLHRSSVRNWREGISRSVRNWKQVIGMSVGLKLNQEETSRLLQAAGHPPIEDLWRTYAGNEDDHELLSRWAKEVHKRHKLTPFHAPRNLPHFVGRKAELEALKEELLAGGHVTLIGLEGMAGVGKTVLAIQIAHQLSFHFPDGVLWAQLNTSDTMSILSIWAEAYGHDVSKHTDVESRSQVLREVLASKKALIVLDNARSSKEIEPLLPPTGTSPVIVTTRHRYLSALRGARRLFIGPFDEQKGEAFDLFVKILGKEHVQAERAALDEIAKLLEYLPLAVDIAASRLAYEPNWTAFELLERLRPEKQRLSELEFEHDSVQASFNLSYDALPIELQQFFAMLGVFGGDDFSVEAVAHIAEMAPNEAEDNLRKLYGLSLIQEGRQGRYRLHSLLRDYGRQKLSGEEVVYERMVDYFVGYIKEHKTAYDALDLERINILAAFGIAADRGMQGALIQGTNMLYQYMETRGLSTQAETYLKKAEKAARQLKDIEGLMTTLVNLGRALTNLGSYKSAEGYLQAALTLAPGIGNPHSEGDALNTLGVVYRNLGEYYQSIEFSGRALDVYHEIGDRRGEGNALNNLGNAHGNLGEYHHAIDCYQQALVIVREIGNLRGEGDALNNLGIMYKNLGEHHRAIEYYEHALAIYRKIGYGRGEANALGNLGIACSNLGESNHAIKFYEQQLQIVRAISDRRGEGNALNNLGLVYSDLGKLHRAADLHKQALAIQQKIGNRSGEADALSCLGIVYQNLGGSQRAIEYYEQALAKCHEIGDRRGEGISLSNTGSAYNALGEFHSAIKHCKQALDIYQEIGFRLGEGDAMHHIGNAYRGLEEFQTAVEYYEQSLHIHREIGHRNGEGNALWSMSLSFDKLGDRNQAIVRAQAALEIYEQIEDPTAAEVREQLVKWNADL